MAAVTVTPSRITKGERVTFSGTAFAISGTVTIEIEEEGIVFTTPTDVSGVMAGTGIAWKPTSAGMHNIHFRDGTNTVDLRLQVWT